LIMEFFVETDLQETHSVSMGKQRGYHANGI